MIKLGFSGALKMANEERELSVSAQCKLGGLKGSLKSKLFSHVFTES